MIYLLSAFVCLGLLFALQLYQEFYCNSGGNNLNAGSDAGSPSMTDSAGTGSWTSTTQVYVSVATTGTVTVGQWLSLYTSGAATVPTTVARIITVNGGGGSAWTITVSNTSYSGTQPSSLTTGTNYFARVGGAFLGPNAAVGTPLNFITDTATDASGDAPRVNLAGSYTISSGITCKLGVTYQGMTSAPGDGGKATITSSTTSTALTSGTASVFRDLILTSTAATGATNNGILTAIGTLVHRCSISGCRASGIVIVSGSALVECEVYNCNISNTLTFGGITLEGPGSALRCISHHNTGSNNAGFAMQGTFTATMATMTDCISDANEYGFLVSLSSSSTGADVSLNSCTFSNSVAAGISWTVTSGALNQRLIADSCLFSGNGTYDISGTNADTAQNSYLITNCASYNTGSGFTNGFANSNLITGTITLTGDPFVADSTGNFALNTTAGQGAACANAGRGNFTELYSGYTTPTTSYPYVGAVTNRASSSGTFPTASQVLTGVVFGPTSNLTGNVVLPAASTVESGIIYGPNSSLVGTYPGTTPSGSSWLNASGSTWVSPPG